MHPVELRRHKQISEPLETIADRDIGVSRHLDDAVQHTVEREGQRRESNCNDNRSIQ